MAIYAFYKRRRNHMQLISSANRGRYLRLMAISSMEILKDHSVGDVLHRVQCEGGCHGTLEGLGSHA